MSDKAAATLDEAWATARAALPDNVGLSLHLLALDDWAEAVADGSGDAGIQLVAQGPTPAAALLALADLLNEAAR